MQINVYARFKYEASNRKHSTNTVGLAVSIKSFKFSVSTKLDDFIIKGGKIV